MGKAILILGLAVLALAIVAGWQIGSCELGSFELREEMRDLAAQNPYRIGLAPPKSDEELRNDVIGLAKRHAIQLEPQQVTVGRTGPIDEPVIYLAADYNARVKLPWISFTLHFNPSSAR